MSKKELLQQDASIKRTAAQVAQGSAKSRKFESITSRADLAPLPTLAIATLIAQSDLIGIDGRDSTVISSQHERNVNRISQVCDSTVLNSRPFHLLAQHQANSSAILPRVSDVSYGVFKASQPIFGEEGELSRLVDPSEVDP